MTDRWVAAFRPPLGGRAQIGDALCPGLYLRSSSGGAKSWSAVFRAGERIQRITIGRYPVITLATAREETLRLLRAAADGSLERERAAAANAVPEATFGELMDVYVTYIQRKARSWKLIASNLRRPEIQPLHGRPAISVTKRELTAIIDDLAEVAPSAATNLQRHLKMAFNYLVQRDLLASNPLDNVRPPAPHAQRDRVLTDDELGRVWRACGELPQPWQAMIRMLMLTGCRRNEIARMSHAEIEGDTLVIPAARMKMKRPHAVPLVPAAIAVLAPLRTKAATGFVFTNDGGETAASNFAKIKRKLDEASGVGRFCLHDFRRTLRTGLAAMGVSRDVARAVIGHADSKVDTIYNRFEYETERREALRMWSERVLNLAA